MAKNSNNIGKRLLVDLRKIIPNPKSELEFNSVFELLVAVMLSAQCTDKRVNIITRELFKKYNSPEQFANLEEGELEELIKSCNYYKNKAKNIIEASKILVGKFGGDVPSGHKDLVSLPGVGNKTANVVQAVGFNIQAFAVDTHILRVANRLGLANTDNPTKCEVSLKEIFKDMDFCEVHHLMLLFGRYYCTAKKPKCENCVFIDICKYKG
jgi:endonuclease-3